jgi:hypothetical protein
MKSNWVIILIAMLFAGLLGGIAWVVSSHRKEATSGPAVAPAIRAAEPAAATPAPVAAAPRLATAVAEPAPAPPAPAVKKGAVRSKKAPAVMEVATPVAAVPDPPHIEVYRGAERQVVTPGGADPVNIEMLRGGQRQNVVPPMPANRTPKD